LRGDNLPPRPPNHTMAQQNSKAQHSAAVKPGRSGCRLRWAPLVCRSCVYRQGRRRDRGRIRWHGAEKALPRSLLCHADPSPTKSAQALLSDSVAVEPTTPRRPCWLCGRDVSVTSKMLPPPISASASPTSPPERGSSPMGPSGIVGGGPMPHMEAVATGGTARAREKAIATHASLRHCVGTATCRPPSKRGDGQLPYAHSLLRPV